MQKKEELYDVLDSDRNVVGESSWDEIHKNNLLHQVVACFIFNNESREKILLQKRSLEMKQDSGLWNHSAGGHVAKGEQIDEAMRRELSEEVFGGKDFPNLVIFKITDFENRDMPGNNEILHLFVMFYDGPIIKQKEEVSRLKWINFSELISNADKHPSFYTTSFKNALREYLRIKPLI